MSAKRRKRALSLFSGAGGLDLGLEMAGFDAALCVEIDADSKRTLSRNRPKWRLAEPGDVHALTPQQIMEQAKLSPRELTLLAGGPPCQPFSKSGYWVSGDAKRLDDPRSSTLGAYLHILEAALPEVVLLENVKGLVYNKKDEGLALLMKELQQINARNGTRYDPVVVHLNAADYGVPQRRERVFIIAHRAGNRFEVPVPTHGPSDGGLFSSGRHPYRTAWDAIGDLDTPHWPEELNSRGKWAELLPSIPEGENYQWHTDRAGGEPLFGWRTRFWSFLLKLAKDQPSWTIQAQPGPATGPFHWKSRELSTQELARLQTFPDTYEISGDRRAAHRQIGNAVPPAIGELLGLEIRRQFFGERVRKKLKLIPASHGECPAPEQPADVPEKYLARKGSHQAHPGTGKGPGALRR